MQTNTILKKEFNLLKILEEEKIFIQKTTNEIEEKIKKLELKKINKEEINEFKNLYDKLHVSVKNIIAISDEQELEELMTICEKIDLFSKKFLNEIEKENKNKINTKMIYFINKEITRNEKINRKTKLEKKRKSLEKKEQKEELKTTKNIIENKMSKLSYLILRLDFEIKKTEDIQKLKNKIKSNILIHKSLIGQIKPIEESESKDFGYLIKKHEEIIKKYESVLKNEDELKKYTKDQIEEDYNNEKVNYIKTFPFEKEMEFLKAINNYQTKMREKNPSTISKEENIHEIIEEHKLGIDWIKSVKDLPSHQVANILSYHEAMTSDLEKIKNVQEKYLSNLIKDFESKENNEETKEYFKSRLWQLKYCPLFPKLESTLTEKNIKNKDFLSLFKEIYDDDKTCLTCSENTLKAKREGLTKLRQLFKEQFPSTTKTVISGAGPAGLCYAISDAFFGGEPLILEKRSQESFKSREQMVALGYNTSQTMSKEYKEMKFLLFTGVYDALAVQGKADIQGKVVDNLIEIPIGDLQNALQEGLSNLMGPDGDDSIKFNCDFNIEEKKNSSGETKSYIKINNDEKEIEVDLFYIAEGKGSSTAEKLGFLNEKLSDKTYMSFSLLENISSKTSLSNKVTSLLNYTKSSLFLGKVISNIVLQMAKLRSTPQYQEQKKLQDRFFIAMKSLFIEGPISLTLILQQAEKRYLFIANNKKEKVIFKKAHDEIKQRTHEINYILNSLQKEEKTKDIVDLIKKDEWWKRKDNRQVVLEKIKMIKKSAELDEKNKKHIIFLLENCETVSKNYQNSKKSLEKLLSKQSSNYILKSQILTKMQRPKYKINLTSYIKGFSVVNQMTRVSEKPLQERGGTIFCLGGDAAATTDPVTGFGCRTAMANAVTTYQHLGRGLSKEATAVAFYAEKYSQELNELAKEGFKSRELYYKGSMRLTALFQYPIKGVDDQSQKNMLFLEGKKRAIDKTHIEGFTETEKKLIQQEKDKLFTFIQSLLPKNNEESNDFSIALGRLLNNSSFNEKKKKQLQETLQTLLTSQPSEKQNLATHKELIRELRALLSQEIINKNFKPNPNELFSLYLFINLVDYSDP